MFNRKDKAIEEAPAVQLTDGEKLAALRQDLIRVQKDRESLRMKFEADELDRSGRKKLSEMDRRIEEAKQAILLADNSMIQKEMDEILMRVESKAKERAEHQKAIEEIDTSADEDRTKMLDLIVRRKVNSQVRIQTASSKTVRMIKETRTIEGSWVSSIFEKMGRAVIGNSTETVKREETLIQAIPARVENMKKAGWVLAPGEKVVEEELTDKNSELKPTAFPQLPAVFSEFGTNYVPWPIPVAMPSR